ncbi:MAG: hypothetical protein ACRELF_27910 [Gemmataceae bacterium]
MTALPRRETDVFTSAYVRRNSGRWARATITAKDGRYRLIGVANNPRYTIVAEGAHHFNCTKDVIADTAGLAPIAVDSHRSRPPKEPCPRSCISMTGCPSNPVPRRIARTLAAEVRL